MNTNLSEIVSIRLTPDQHAKLRRLAESRGCNLGQLIRSAALGEVQLPTGWHCPHWGIQSGPGVIAQPSADCGCEMTPVYDGERLPEWVRRALAEAHKDDFELGTAVAITPWRPRSVTRLDDGGAL